MKNISNCDEKYNQNEIMKMDKKQRIWNIRTP